jgi:hypothetical protein
VERVAAGSTSLVENRDFDAAVHAVLGHVLNGVGESPPIVALRSAASRTK